jgi:hypothetical protein
MRRFMEITGFKKTVPILCVAALCTAARCIADDAGTTGANFLKIPVAPVPTAMGQAYTAISGVDSILYNPAGLGLMNYSAVSLAENNYIEGIHQQYAATALRTDLGTFGAAFTSLSSGQFEAYDVNGADIGTTSSSHMLGVVSYSQSFPHWNQDRDMQDKQLMLSGWSRIQDVDFYRPRTPRISFGVSFKYIHERLDDVSATTTSADAGVVVVPLQRLQLGASLLNINGAEDFGTQAFSLPRTLRVGAATDFVGVKRLMVFRTSADYVKESDMDAYYCAGLEVSVMELISLRIGMRSDSGIGNGMSFGFGIVLDKSNNPDDLVGGIRFDYTYANEGEFDGSQRFGLQVLL